MLESYQPWVWNSAMSINHGQRATYQGMCKRTARLEVLCPGRVPKVTPVPVLKQPVPLLPIPT